MTNMTDQPSKIIYPITQASGQEADPGQVLWDISAEMMDQHIKLLWQVEKEVDTRLRSEYMERSNELQRYATALAVVALQLRPDQFDPKGVEGVLVLAKKHNIALPDWMKGKK